MNTKILTYLNDSALKAAFLAEIGKHEAADALIKGTYGNMNGSFKGCAIGCSLYSLNRLQGKTGTALIAETDQHIRLERELGWPVWLAYLEDHLFEQLPDDLSHTWPRRLSQAVPIGVIISDAVLAKILRWSLADVTYGVSHATTDVKVRGYIDMVIAGFDAEIASEGHAMGDQRKAAARAAWDAWAARDARDARDGFYPALSEYVLAVLNELDAARVQQ